MSPLLPSTELQPWPEFCSLLKNNWGQRGDWMSLIVSRWLLLVPGAAAGWLGWTIGLGQA